MPSYNVAYKKLQDGVNTVSTKRHQHFKKMRHKNILSRPGVISMKT